MLQAQVFVAFLDQIKLVSFHVVKGLLKAAGPVDLDGFGASGFPHAEVGAEVALGEVAAAASNVSNLRDAAGLKTNASAHCVAIGLGADKFEVDEMISVRAAVMEQQRSVAVVGDDDIDETVVVEVGEGDPATHVVRLKDRTGRLAHLSELAIVFIVEERVVLFVVNFGRGLLDFRIDVTIGNKEVEPAVIVVVEETSTKTENVVSRTGDAGLIADFVEKSFAVVLPEMVGRPLKV